MRRVRLRSVFFLLVLFYLSIELSINAALIDTITPALDPPALENIRRTAELLATLGPALLLIQSFVFRDMAIPLNAIRARDVYLCGGIVAGCLFLLTPFEQWTAGRLVALSSPEQRRSALVATAGSVGVIAGNYSLPGVGLTPETLNAPETRAALILFGPLAIMSGAAEKMRADAGPVIAGALFQGRGALAPIFEARRAEFCEQFNTVYQSYSRNSERIEQNWLYRILGLRTFQEKRDEAFGYEAGLTPGLSREDFIRHPDIQAQIRHRIFSAVAEFPMSSQLAHIIPRKELIAFLNDLFARKTLDPCLSWEMLDRTILGPALWRLRGEVQAVVEGERFRTLAEGESLDRVGRQAVYAVVTPPLALAWTLLAGAAGLAALLGLVLKSFLGLGRRIRILISTGLLASIALAPYQKPNFVADSAGFQRLKTVAAERSLLFGIDATLTEWVLRAAPMVHPVGEFLRDHGPGVLLGLDRRG